MSEQSQRDEMNAAIRAHRERHNVPRSIAPEPIAPTAAPSAPAPEPAKQGLLSRLFRR
ncbi:MAG TPA: hypothetical protein VFL60_07875 [Gaiellaceae bacterium]|nr:hypothetical protein [Gaiellaceae bacterium]